MQSDVLVVGAGPAGIATAIAAGLKGLRVTVIDSRRPPVDKACGEGLLPEAVAGLRRIGVELNSEVAFPFHGFRFSDEECSVSARIARGEAFGLRRTALQRLLINRAAEVGITFLWGARISDFESYGVRADGRWIPYRWLVGADGQNSSVRNWARLNPGCRLRSRFGFRRHFSVTPWTDLVEVYWGECCQMVVTPTDRGEICISLFSSDPQLRIEPALSLFPQVKRRLAGARPASAELGAVTALGMARAVVHERVALVGDASCTVDGIAGQGLSLAFQQAIHLAEALAQENLAYYESAHRRITKMATRMTRLLLSMARSAWLRRKTLRLFAREPGSFSKMISIHTGESGLDVLRAREIFNLGWEVLWA